MRALPVTALPSGGGSARATAAVGVMGVLTGAGVVGLLHVIPPSSYVSPTRRTISEYALLENGWAFDTAVLALAAGSTAIGYALGRARLIRAVSVASVALLLWVLGLVGVVVFPKHNRSVGPSLDGHIHRGASLSRSSACRSRHWSLVLPGVGIHSGGGARLCLGLGVVSLLCFAPIAGAILLEPVTGVRWWRAVPLGAVERSVAAAEVATVLWLGWWAVRAACQGLLDHEVAAAEPRRS